MAEQTEVNKPSQPSGPTDETLKDTFQSIIIAFVLAFTFRAYVVEAFVIPTGSMAPTLLGAHLPITCSECGYQFEVDGGTQPSRNDPQVVSFHCPMCHYANTNTLPTVPHAGDRILVQKYPYYFGVSQPRRWDVVVFKAPHDPDENYIKRLTGLPGEAIQIVNGNVFVRPVSKTGTREDGTPNYEIDRTTSWRIARKVDPAENPHWEEIQRAVWQPVYHSQFLPKDAGKMRDDGFRWQPPWIPSEPEQWHGLGGSTGDDGERDLDRIYTFTGQGRGEITFDWSTAYAGSSGPFPYNMLRERYTQMFDEIRIATTVIPQSDDLRVELETQAYIYDEESETPLSAVIDGEGNVTLYWKDAKGKEQGVVGDTVAAFKANRPTNIELWYVDMELSCWVNGEQVAVHRFEISDEDVPWDAMRFRMDERNPSGTWPRPKISVSGPATLSHVELDRDLHYVTYTSTSAKGVGEPYIIMPDQFFCMGDNSPSSKDSRSWEETAAWINERKFTEDGPPHDGVVPRRMMMGRAFFVYFPAPYALGDSSMKFIPNFGKMRFIH